VGGCSKRTRAYAAYWITSSASKSRLSEILMPSIFAVLRLSTRSNLLGRTTGKSAAFSPLRMLALGALVRPRREYFQCSADLLIPSHSGTYSQGDRDHCKTTFMMPDCASMIRHPEVAGD
jgi:hypothetical protein